MERYKPLYVEKYELSFRVNNREVKKDDEYEYIFSHPILPERKLVIRTVEYIKLVDERVSVFYKMHKNRWNLSDEIIEALNEEFKSFNFIFVKDNFNNDIDKDNVGIYLSKRDGLDITFYCNNYIADILIAQENFVNFKNKFLNLLEKELDFRGNFLDKKNKELWDKLIERKKRKIIIDHYRCIQEAIVYAKLIIEELRFGGFANNEILNILKYRDKDISDLFDFFAEVYEEMGDDCLSLLYRYAQDHLRG